MLVAITICYSHKTDGITELWSGPWVLLLVQKQNARPLPPLLPAWAKGTEAKHSRPMLWWLLLVPSPAWGGCTVCCLTSSRYDHSPCLAHKATKATANPGATTCDKLCDSCNTPGCMHVSRAGLWQAPVLRRAASTATAQCHTLAAVSQSVL